MLYFISLYLSQESGVYDGHAGQVNRALSVPPMPFDLPLVADPTHMVTVSPPAAHIGPGPVQMRLISYELREGQVQQFTLMSLTDLISLES